MNLSLSQWMPAALAALFAGLSKSGLPAFGLLPVVLKAGAFPARESTGIVLPMLVCGDAHIPQRLFKHLALLFSAAAAVKLAWF